ncbi:ABC transporter permease [Candidatus Methanomassiliicoccus intestinalis]|uniref:ABC transporter permease n=1 Tax=Candidatus Methanomassiliicoccus intestinalis TaxID=1406512 RepID=UPI0037DD7EEC
MYHNLATLIAKSHQNLATFNSLVILPMSFLCGTFFSASSVPTIFQYALYLFPLTHSGLCIRASALGWAFPWASLLVLIAFGIAFYAIDVYLLKTRKV